jgi:hypothetical protein
MWSCVRTRLPFLTNDPDYDVERDQAVADAHEFGWVDCHDVGDSNLYTLNVAGQVALEAAYPY